MPAASIFLEAGSGQATRLRNLFGSRVVVRVFDENDNFLPNEPVEFSLPVPLSQPTGRFPGDAPTFTTLTDANGQARSEVIKADDFVGVWLGTVSPVANPLVSADFYLSNEPFATPTTVQIIANGTQTAAYFTDFQPVVARLLDEFGTAIPFAALTMTCPSGTGTFPGGSNSATVSADPSGNATFPPFTAANFAGTFNPTIANGGVSANATFTVVDPSIPAYLTPYTGNNQVVSPTLPFPQPLVVRVNNGAGGPVAGVVVKFDAPDSGASLVWAAPYSDPVTVTSDINGLATSPAFSANATGGTYLVTVTQLRVNNPTYFQLTNGSSPGSGGDNNALLFCEV